MIKGGKKTMEKRQLTDIEKRISLKNLDMLKADAEYIEKVEIPKKDFTINTADVIVKKQLKDAQLEKNILQSKLDELKRTIKIVEKQIRGGVEIKNNKKEE